MSCIRILEFGHHFLQRAAYQGKGDLLLAVSRLLESLVKKLHIPSDKKIRGVLQGLVFLTVGIQEYGTGAYQRYGSLALPYPSTFNPASRIRCANGL